MNVKASVQMIFFKIIKYYEHFSLNFQIFNSHKQLKLWAIALHSGLQHCDATWELYCITALL